MLAPAQAAAVGAPQLAALPLMLLAAASALAALRSGRAAPPAGAAPVALAAREAPASRAARGVVLLALALPAGLVGGAALSAVAGVGEGGPHPLLALAPLCLGCLLAGAGHGRFTVALLELLDDLVPARNAVEALTWLTSAQGAGLALGALLGGAVA